MATPEFVREEHGEFILVANHNVMEAENVSRSIAYNRARILHAREQLPEHLARCRVIYDVRGQAPADDVLDNIKASLSDICIVEFKR